MHYTHLRGARPSRASMTRSGTGSCAHTTERWAGQAAHPTRQPTTERASAPAKRTMKRCRQRGAGEWLRARTGESTIMIRDEHGGQCCAGCHRGAQYSARIPLMHRTSRRKNNPDTVPRRRRGAQLHDALLRLCELVHFFLQRRRALRLPQRSIRRTRRRKDATRNIPCNTQRNRRCNAAAR